jgi:hypothetical protein
MSGLLNIAPFVLALFIATSGFSTMSIAQSSHENYMRQQQREYNRHMLNNPPDNWNSRSGEPRYSQSATPSFAENSALQSCSSHYGQHCELFDLVFNGCISVVEGSNGPLHKNYIPYNYIEAAVEDAMSQCAKNSSDCRHRGTYCSDGRKKFDDEIQREDRWRAKYRVKCMALQAYPVPPTCAAIFPPYHGEARRWAQETGGAVVLKNRELLITWPWP